jgi:uncharacterized membrane protein
MNLTFLIFLVAFFSANIILIQKNFILKNVNENDYFCIKNGLIFLFVLVFMTFIKKDTISNIQKIDRKLWMYIIGEVSLSIVNILLWYYLLQQTEAHKLTGSINPLSLVIITILSIFVYKKIISKKELVGILLVILGVLLLNSK